MSCNRENVVWKTHDGTWSIGFYDFWETGDDDTRDPEWDVEYDYKKFHWVSTGHATDLMAKEAWTGANPRCYQTHEDLNDRTDRFNAMAEACKAEMKRYSPSFSLHF